MKYDKTLVELDVSMTNKPKMKNNDKNSDDYVLGRNFVVMLQVQFSPRKRAEILRRIEEKISMLDKIDFVRSQYSNAQSAEILAFTNALRELQKKVMSKSFTDDSHFMGSEIFRDPFGDQFLPLLVLGSALMVF